MAALTPQLPAAATSAIISPPLLHRETHCLRAAASLTPHPLLDHCLLASLTCHIENGSELARGLCICRAALTITPEPVERLGLLQVLPQRWRMRPHEIANTFRDVQHSGVLTALEPKVGLPIIFLNWSMKRFEPVTAPTFDTSSCGASGSPLSLTPP